MLEKDPKCGTGPSSDLGAKLKNLEWTDLGVRGSRLMGDESTIAQVHPKEYLGTGFIIFKGWWHR